MAHENNIPELLLALEDIQPINREQAIKSLSDLGDKSSSVRQAAAQSFQKGLSDKCIMPTLIKALKDPAKSVRGTATHNLNIFFLSNLPEY